MVLLLSNSPNEAKDLTPVLIIPGFMSSGLTIQKSPHKSWIGKRLWLNIASLGFNSLHVGGALRKNETKYSNRALDAGASDGGVVDPSSDEMHQEYLKQMECKSKWVWHLRLKSDMIHEKDGVEVVRGCLVSRFVKCCYSHNNLLFDSAEASPRDGR